MAINFPTSLPLPTRDGYARAFARPIKRTAMDDGAYKKRRTASMQPIKFGFSWSLKPSQMALFEAFFAYDLNYGENSFILTYSGSEPIEVRFTEGGYTEEFNGGHWKVTGQFIHLRPGNLIPFNGSPISWPIDIPLPEGQGYTSQFDEPFVEGQIGNGLVKTRNRSTYKERRINVGWSLTQTERDNFWEFYRTTLRDGMMPFNMDIMTGQGMANVRVEFTDNPTESADSANYRIDAVLATYFAPKLAKSVYDATKNQGICK